uniref:Ste24 endopeptidase n=1 Tax=uncultured bacterium Contig11 TaxID=1393376 RepID=W0FQY5_9BACT|nr:ste24 endopeptidase [uncultured bacterium Contig11]
MGFKAWVLIIISIVYLYSLLLNLIRMRSAKNPIPENVADVYDRETYEKWRAYHTEKTRFDILASTVSFAIDFCLMALNAYAAFAGLFPKSDFMQLFAVVLLSSLTSILMIPFSWHETMGIEEKYGFNKSKAGTFWADQMKNFLIELILMTGICALLMVVHQALGDWLILVFAVLMMLLVLAISFLFPILSKVFNKFKPLEDGELNERLTALLEKNGYKVRGIRVMDASRRTTKSNAYFTGFGKMKTIVLYDTLVESMTPDEICAVFAHEMGHGLHKDTLKNQILSFFQMLILAVLAWLTLRTAGLFLPFGFEGINYGFAVLLIMSVEFALISPLFGLITSWHSRKAEYRADEQAVKEGYGEALISALKTLARQNYADLSPSPLLVKLEYSHPTLSQRIDAIRNGKH